MYYNSSSLPFSTENRVMLSSRPKTNLCKCLKMPFLLLATKCKVSIMYLTSLSIVILKIVSLQTYYGKNISAFEGLTSLIDRCRTLLAPPTLPPHFPNLDFSKPKSNQPIGFIRLWVTILYSQCLKPKCIK